MFDQLGLRGWPACVILDYDGTLLYGKEVPFRVDRGHVLDRVLAEVMPLYRLRDQVAKLEPGATDGERLRAELTLWEAIIKPAQADFAQVQAAAKIPGLDAKLVQRALDLGARLPFQRIYERYEKEYYGSPNPREQRKARTRAMRATYELLKAGKSIVDRHDELHHRFWLLAFDGALEAKDYTRAQGAVDVYGQIYGKSPAGQREAGKMRTRLEKAKNAGT